MMPREWTDRTSAHPFKRLAQLAVLGLALAVLAACGGSTVRDLVEAVITPDLNEYGSAAFRATTSRWGGYGIANNTSRAEARADALSVCGSDCQEVLWFRNACGAIAKSTDNTRGGAGWGTSESSAGEEAIAACSRAGGQGCRVATSSEGKPAILCAQAGSATPTGEAVRIPAKSTQPGTQPGTQTPTSITFRTTDACNDGKKVQMRFFEQRSGVRTGRRWPGGNSVYTTLAVGTAVLLGPFACSSGINICYGAQIEDSTTYFGLGLDGTERCNDCCYKCGPSPSLRFGCGS